MATVRTFHMCWGFLLISVGGKEGLLIKPLTMGLLRVWKSVFCSKYARFWVSRLQSKTVWLKLYDHRESVMHVFWVCANFYRGGWRFTGWTTGTRTRSSRSLSEWSFEVSKKVENCNEERRGPLSGYFRWEKMST